MLLNFPSHGISLKSGAKLLLFYETAKLKVYFQVYFFAYYLNIVAVS